jgi:hypothetical protein
MDFKAMWTIHEHWHEVLNNILHQRCYDFFKKCNDFNPIKNMKFIQLKDNIYSLTTITKGTKKCIFY